MTNAVKTAPVLTFITCLLSGCGPEKEVYNFPGGFQVEGYWEATGFMDAGTVFEVYQLSDGFFSFKKRIGYAVNWETDYINMKPKPTVELTPKAVIVTHIYGSDTLLIQGDKYYRGIPRTRRI